MRDDGVFDAHCAAVVIGHEKDGSMGCHRVLFDPGAAERERHRRNSSVPSVPA